MPAARCPVCGIVSTRESLGLDVCQIECSVCGRYDISTLFYGTLTFPDEREKLFPLLRFLPAYTRAANSRQETPKLLATNWEALAREHASTPVAQKLSKLLEVLAANSKHPGAWVNFDSKHDYPLCDASNETEVNYLLGTLRIRGDLWQSVDYKDHPKDEWAVTAQGWERVTRVVPGGEPGTCFVAMAFAEDLNAAYDEGIYPAVVEDCGLRIMRTDRVEYNGIVNDLMMAEIIGCQFLIADVTLQRNGVYFEAGFALGLGRTVIWTCRKDEMPKVHFDTRQYGHVEWTDPFVLRQRLTNRIRGTVQLPAKSSRGTL